MRRGKPLLAKLTLGELDMTSALKLVQLGEWPAVATQAAAGTYSGAISLTTLGSQGATVTGSGTVQTNGTALSATTTQVSDDIVYVSTVNGTTNNSVQLVNQGGAFITIFNGSGTTMLVFPPQGGSINGQTTNASYGTSGSAFGIAGSKSTSFITPDGLNWFAQHAG
jgi:hypothetical protein